MAGKKMNPIVELIKEDWGTMTHFCRKKNLNYNTLKGYIYGWQNAPDIQALLIEEGYIQDGSEIKRVGGYFSEADREKASAQ